MSNRVDDVLNTTDFSKYQDVLIIGVTPEGLIDPKPSIAQYPWVHWIMNKTLAEMWLLERGEVEKRVAEAEAKAQTVPGVPFEPDDYIDPVVAAMEAENE